MLPRVVGVRNRDEKLLILHVAKMGSACLRVAATGQIHMLSWNAFRTFPGITNF